MKKKKGEVQKVVDNIRLDLTDSILDKESLHTTTNASSGVEQQR